MRKVIIGIFLLAGLIGGSEGCTKRQTSERDVDLSGRNVLMVIAPQNFRDEEYQVPRERLEKCGAKITVAASSLTESVGMKRELRVTADILLKDVKTDDYDAIIFVGGIGAAEYFDNLEAYRLAREAVDKNKILAAICLAPAILARSGVLKGKQATVYETEKETLTKRGALYQEGPVVKDGRIITADGPEATYKFTERIKQALSKNR